MPAWMVKVRSDLQEEDESNMALAETNSKRTAPTQSTDSDCEQHTSKRRRADNTSMTE